jgi:hypothetical protein
MKNSDMSVDNYNPVGETLWGEVQRSMEVYGIWKFIEDTVEEMMPKLTTKDEWEISGKDLGEKFSKKRNSINWK